MKKRIVSVMLIFALSVGLIACGSSESKESEESKAEENETEEDSDSDKKVIRIGTIEVDVPTVEAGRESMEELGYEIEIVTFEDAIMPNTALMEGSIDANLFQHAKYMNGFASEKGADFTMLEPVLILSRYAMYSSKYDNYNELPDNATIAISSDASNKERSLKMLQDIGLITLADKPEDSIYTVFDIVENPKNLQFTEVLDVQIPTLLEDVDMIVVYNPHMIQGGYDTSNPLYMEKDDAYVDYGVGITVNTVDAESQWAKDLIKGYTTDKTKDNMDKLSGDRGFEVLR